MGKSFKANHIAFYLTHPIHKQICVSCGQQHLLRFFIPSLPIPHYSMLVFISTQLQFSQIWHIYLYQILHTRPSDFIIIQNTPNLTQFQPHHLMQVILQHMVNSELVDFGVICMRPMVLSMRWLSWGIFPFRIILMHSLVILLPAMLFQQYSTRESTVEPTSYRIYRLAHHHSVIAYLNNIHHTQIQLYDELMKIRITIQYRSPSPLLDYIIIIPYIGLMIISIFGIRVLESAWYIHPKYAYQLEDYQNTTKLLLYIHINQSQVIYIKNQIMLSQLQPFFPQDVSAKRCGCYIRRPDVLGLKFAKALVPLKHIDYHLEVVNSLVNFTLKQKYQNPTDQFLEVDYSLPISPESSIYKFEAEFNNVKIQGIVKQKEQAKKQFEQAKSEGRQAVLGTIDPNSKDILNLEIGNIPPKTQFTVTISFLQEMTISLNTFYRIQVPSTISPRYMNVVDQRKQQLKKKNQPNLIKGKPQFDWSFKIDLITTRKVIFFDSPSHNITLLNQNEKGTETLLVMANAEAPNKDFTFVYTTEDFHLPSYVLGNTDVSSTVMLSFIPKFCNLDVNDAYKASIANKSYETDMSTAKGDYIFFLDRSGSMSGTRIEKAKQALILFLKSLPQDSYFNVISFGSGSQKMFPTSQKNDSKKIKQSVQKIKKMSADMGGTEIYQILRVILQQKVQQGYPRHLFLLTDGGVSNTQGVIQMVRKNTKYARVHCIGIGNGASYDLIQGCAQSGKGKFVMISDQENPAEKIIQLLETTLTPLISKVSLKCSSENNIDSIVPNPKSIPYILKDDVVNFYITFKGPFTENKQFTFEYEDSVTKLPYKATMQVQPSTLNQPFVDKMAHLKVLRSLQNCAKDGVTIDDQMYYVKVKDFKEEAVKYSVQHQVLSEYTAFLCIGKELVDGQYQQYKATGLQHAIVEQPKPIQYQEKQMCKMMAPSSYSSSAMHVQKRSMAMPMRMGQQRSYQKLAMCAPKKKSAGLGIVDTLSSVGSSIASSVSGLFSNTSSKKPVTTTNAMRSSAKQQESLKQPMKMMECCDQADNDNDQIQQQCLRSEKLGDLLQQQDFSEIKKQKKIKKDQISEKLEKKQKNAVEKGSKDSKKVYKVEDIIQLQAADGSWDDIKLVDKLASKPKEVSELCKQINQLVVITKLVILWMQKHHPEKQYALIIKKAISWLNKSIKENSIDEAILNTIEAA